jgi:hypothetical protein
MLSLDFDEDFTLPAGDARRRAARLLTVELQPAAALPKWDLSQPGSLRPASPGIDQDGWAARHADLTLPANPAPATLVLRFEFPGWAGRDSGQVRAGFPGQPVKAQRLNPGFNELRLPLDAADATRMLSLDFDEDFALPAGDGRRRAARLLTVELQPSKP